MADGVGPWPVASAGGFMLAHSTLLTMTTEFAAKARGTAMSLVAFSMMGGGALGTALGGRVIEASSFTTFYGAWAVLLVGLSAVSFLALSEGTRVPVAPMAVPAKDKMS